MDGIKFKSKTNSPGLHSDRQSLMYPYALVDWSFDEIKDEFHINLQKAKCSDVIIIAGAFNAQIGSLNQTKRY